MNQFTEINLLKLCGGSLDFNQHWTLIDLVYILFWVLCNIFGKSKELIADRNLPQSIAND